MNCPLSHICIRCAHGGHAACRRVVTCPDDGQERGPRMLRHHQLNH